ncbi:MAG: YraN family protein [Pigmentiphaga sp.]|uniref:YraN family protein n=1 Tax=Pigmentiphaga sp. TaxID=1977564 RepID=UPI0029BD44BF|nr:YraN family protein [Pigmentiphaga sp.]MDX3907890.1 YraN family protein [Pigmentiphaga sp.]
MTSVRGIGPPLAEDETLFALAHAAQRRAARKRARKPPSRPAAATAPARRSPMQQAGDRAERRALDFLRAAGLQPVARNVACRAGEIDLIMRDGPVLVFVEVRARAGNRYGGAAASVGPAKQVRLVRAARYFLQARWRGPAPPCRFDVLAFEADGPPRWIRHAFSAQ